MIILTSVKWSQKIKNKEIDPVIEEAKRSVLGDEYEEPESSDEYEEVDKRCVIDTVCDKIYIEVDENEICMSRLLDSQYVYSEESNSYMRIEDKLYFKGDLDEIHEKLLKEQKTINNN